MPRGLAVTPVLPVAAVLTGVSWSLVLGPWRPGWSIPAASPFVMVAMTVAVLMLLRVRAGVQVGFVLWRRVMAGLVVVAAAYPGLWGLAALVSAGRPGSTSAWAIAIMAGVGHLPVLAAFSALPVLAVGYLGPARLGAVLVVVGVLGGLAAVLFVLFFDPVPPLAAPALVDSGPGEAVGATVHLLFSASVLVGPAVSLHAVRAADGAGARRLALVTASSLAGTVLVMLCGAVGGQVEGPGGGVVVLVGMYAAVVVLAAGCTRALPTRAGDVPTRGVPVTGDPATTGGRSGGATAGNETGTRPDLTDREQEVLSLLAAGLSNAGIAARLVVSERTVDAHLRSVFLKLDLPRGPGENRRVHAAVRWVAGQAPGGVGPRAGHGTGAAGRIGERADAPGGGAS